MKRAIAALMLCVALPIVACSQQTAQQPLTLEVKPAPLVIITLTIPTALLNVLYSAPIVAQGGLAPYTWDVETGPLPPGLSLEITTGTLVGTPSQTGLFSFVVRVTDSSGVSATQKFQIGKVSSDEKRA